MKYKRRLLLTLLLGLLAWTVPLAAQTPPIVTQPRNVAAPKVESVKVYIKGTNPSASEVFKTATMDARGNALPVTFVIECYPSGSWQSVTGINLDVKGDILKNPGFVNPRREQKPWLKRTDLGWELTVNTNPAETKGEATVSVKLSSIGNASHSFGEVKVVAEYTPVTGIELTVEPQGQIIVGRGGTIKVAHTPPDATDKRVKFEYDAKYLTIEPTEKVDEYRFTAKGQSNVKIKAAAENGRSTKATAETTISTVEHTISSIKLNMNAGGEQGGAGYDNEIYRHKTKVWHIEAVVTSDGPIEGDVYKKVGWSFLAKQSGHTRNGADAAIYGNSKEGVNDIDRGVPFSKVVYPQFESEHQYKEPNGEYKTVISYAFKADKVVNENPFFLLKLELIGRPDVNSTYRLKIGEYFVNHFKIDPLDTSLFVVSEPNGFITVTPEPEMAYERRYKVTGQGKVTDRPKPDGSDPNRWNFGVTTEETGTRTLTITAVDAKKYSQDVTVFVKKQAPTKITVRYKTTGKEIPEGGMLELKKGEKVDLEVSVDPKEVYDARFKLRGSKQDGAAWILHDNEAGKLKITAKNQKLGLPDVYTVEAIESSPREGAVVFATEANMDGGSSSSNLPATLSFKYRVDANPVDGIAITKGNEEVKDLTFTYDVDAKDKIREGVQVVNINVTPPTAADRTFAFEGVPEWLDILNTAGQSVKKRNDLTSGDYYFKVRQNHLNAVGVNRDPKTKTISVVSKDKKVTSTLQVTYKYIPVTGYKVSFVDELIVNKPKKLTIAVDPPDASNPHFKLVVESNRVKGLNKAGTWSGFISVLNASGRKVNGSASLSFAGSVESKPGEFTVVSSKKTEDAENLSFKIIAVEKPTVSSKEGSFVVRVEAIERVKHKNELVVEIRDEYFRHAYTALKVEVVPNTVVNPRLKFVNAVDKKKAPTYVDVEGPVNGYYLFTPKNKNQYEDHEEQIVTVPEDETSSFLNDGNITVKVVNVKATSIEVVNMAGEDITKTPNPVVRGVTKSFPFRVKVKPWNVSLASVELKHVVGPTNLVSGLQPSRIVRDSAAGCLVMDFLLENLDRDFGKEKKAAFTVGHKHPKEGGISIPTVTFKQEVPEIETLTVEPAEVTLVGDGAKALVKVTYTPGNAFWNGVNPERRRLSNVTVTEISHLDNVYTYELSVKTFSPAQGAVVFNPSAGAAKPVECKVEVINAEKLQSVAFSSTEPVVLTLGETGKDYVDFDLIALTYAKTAVADRLFEAVEWNVKGGGEFSKYLKVEKLKFDTVDVGHGIGIATKWTVRLTGLNVTADGVNKDRELLLQAKLGIRHTEKLLPVKVVYGEKANEKTVERVAFPMASLELAVGETKTVDVQVTPQDVSLQRLSWDFPGRGAGRVNVREGATWNQLQITGATRGETWLRVRAADRLGAYTSPLLHVKVDPGYCDLVLDVVDGEANPLDGVHVVVESIDERITKFDGYTTSSSNRVIVQGVIGKRYRVTASRGGYKTVDVRFQASNSLKQKKLVLVRNLSEPVLYGVRVKVDDGTNPIPGAEVVLAGFKPQQTNADGVAQYYQVPAGSYSVSVRADGFEPSSKVINHVGDKNTEEVAISLQKSSTPSVAKHALLVTVTDAESGEPLQDARVTLEAGNMSMTDILGQVKIEKLANGTYGILVEGPANGWTSPEGTKVSFDPQALSREIKDKDEVMEVSLKRVKAGSNPVVPATHKLTVIVCESEFGGLLNGAAVRLSGVASKVTEGGQVVFNGLVGTQQARRVDVSKAGYESQSKEVVVSNRDEIVRFVLVPQTYSVTLTVKGEDGSALSGATVYLDGSKKQVTGQDGVVTFEKVRSGKHGLMVAAVGYKDSKMTIEVASDFNGELQLVKGVSPVLNERTLTIVVKEGIKAVDGATVRLESGEEQVTDVHGKAQFKVLDGEYTVTVSKKGYDAANAKVTVDGDKEQTIAIKASASLDVLRVVTISVVDAVTGESLSTAEVKVLGATPTHHEGNVWVYELKKGKYRYVVSCEGYQNQVAELSVDKSNKEVPVKLTRGVNAKFTVTVTVASSGSPVEGANVEIEGQTAISTEKNVTKFSLESGVYTVKVRKKGYATAEQEVFVDGKDAAVTVELRPMLKVIFNANGGKFTDGSLTKEVKVAEGDRVSPLSENPERSGFKFTAWFLDGKEYNFAEKVNQSITLEAQWEDVTTTGHTVTFMANGGKFANGKDVRTIKVEGGQPIGQSQIEIPELPGRKFAGWTLPNGTAYTPGVETVNTDITLLAKWEEQKWYVVSFEVAGGKPQPRQQLVLAGEKAKEPTPEPTKDGYSFVEWRLGSDKYDFEKTTVDRNIVLMAHWNPDATKPNVTVTFNSDGGSEVSEQKLLKGDVATRPVPDPTKVGFTFQGWYLDGATESYDFSTPVNDNITLTAKWKEKVAGTAKVTFTVKDKAKKVKGAVVAIGDKTAVTNSEGIAVVKDLDKQLYHYTVMHDSYVTKTDVVDLSSGDQSVTVELEAKTMFTVTFNSDGGSEVPEQKVEKDGAATEPVPAPTKDGFTLKGWCLDGETELYNFNTPVTKNITLKAQWKVILYTVTFNSDGGSPVKEKPVKHGETVAKPDDPTKDGFTFKGWCLDGATELYDFDTPVTGNITLKAVWEEISENATVTFTVKDDAKSVVGGAQIKIDGKTKETLSDGTVVIDGLPKKANLAYEVTKVGYNPATGTVDLTAGDKQEAVTLVRATYTVTFNSNGGTAVVEQNVKYNEKATEPTPVPTKDGYTFDGWYLGNVRYDFDWVVTGNIALMANWKPDGTKTTFTVKFDVDGGSPEYLPQTINDGDLAYAPVPAPQKDGFTFKGWYQDGATESYDFTKPVNADITLKAKWEAKSTTPTTYTVTFDFNDEGKTESVKKTVNAGETVAKPTDDPTREGYDFVEWQLNGVAYDFGTKVNADITLKAVWKANGQQPTTYTVTFDSDGGSAVAAQTVKAGETVGKPADPTKEGYTFVEWQLDGVAYDFSQPVNGNITLKAKWEENGTAVESELLATVRIYPNPATVTLVVSAESVIARYELVSLNGTKVLSGISSESELRLNVSQLADGVYVLLLEDAEGGVATRRVSVRR